MQWDLVFDLWVADLQSLLFGTDRVPILLGK